MWVHEMTDEQKREYGFVNLSISELQRLGYVLAKTGWKKVQPNGEVRVWQGGQVRVIRDETTALPNLS
ncbi:hypothetical protein J1TS5_26160 [Paenibacillus macerans]|uniref:hypothetical protein n=1 Tax=Paenibacillus macerans TaxID=44252 RepID=UPI001B29A8C8|nr:hypothetical protein [Paenibacillus macerans]GIP10446.1 hypothetical protein J1TS5_26160 [Paenibacillus macerans]